MDPNVGSGTAGAVGGAGPEEEFEVLGEDEAVLDLLGRKGENPAPERDGEFVALSGRPRYDGDGEPGSPRGSPALTGVLGRGS